MFKTGMTMGMIALTLLSTIPVVHVVQPLFEAPAMTKLVILGTLGMLAVKDWTVSLSSR